MTDPSNTPDYYGLLWSAIRQQERILQASRLLEMIDAVPTVHRSAPLDAIDSVRKLLNLNQMELSRRLLLFTKHIQAGGSP
jgi:hypothetical protein